ncbi:MAG TPA: PilN domain-containing protein [Pyrinomonadaceae bacterium]|jgi:Tfp pilus assembly protein PilN|nr:PilN domain-containing protein [Pyrinomonadaceae bacterium]
MIKVNLLESVTDRPASVAFVEDKVSNTRTQTLLLGLTIMALLVLGIGFDYVSTNKQHETAVKQLEKEKRINDEMNAVKREQADLEKKLNDINLRIDAIQKLRGSQQGPSAVLAELKTRFDAVPGLYLKSVEQKDGEIIVKGESPNEGAVTRFGQSMEFSSGLFTNLNIETERKTAEAKSSTGAAAAPAAPAANLNIPGVPMPEVVAFTIKCSYAGAKPPEPANNTASAPKPGANNVAARN